MIKMITLAVADELNAAVRLQMDASMAVGLSFLSLLPFCLSLIIK